MVSFFSSWMGCRGIKGSNLFPENIGTRAIHVTVFSGVKGGPMQKWGVFREGMEGRREREKG